MQKGLWDLAATAFLRKAIEVIYFITAIYTHGLVQNKGNFSVLPVELPQSCAKPSV